MMSATTAPGIWFNGDTYEVTPTDPATDGPTQLANLLESGAFTATGATVLHIGAGELSQAYTGQPNASSIAHYQSVFSTIATYCNQHDIKVAVEADFNADWNNQWIQAAQTAGLPVAYVEDDQEGPLYGILTGTPSTLGNYTSVSSPDIQNDNLTTLPQATIDAVTNLVQSYSSGLQEILAAYPAAQFGTWNGMFVGEQGTYNLLTQTYFQQLQTEVDSLPGEANAKPVYVVEEANWSGSPTDTSWEPAFASFSAAMRSVGVPQVFSVEIPQDISNQGVSATVQQTNSLLEDRLAQVASDASISLNDLNIEFADAGDTAAPDAPINDPTSVSNLAAIAAALYPLYQNGVLTYSGSLHISGRTAAVTQIAVAVSEGLSLTASPSNSGDIAVVVLDQTGLLAATQAGSATVTGSGTSTLVLVGDASDVAAELRSLAVTEPGSDADFINVQAFGAAGLLGDYVGLLEGATTISASNSSIDTPVNGSTSLTMQGGGNVVSLNGQNDSLVASSSVETVQAGAGNVDYTNGGAADDFVGGSGAVTIRTGTGGGTYTTGARASLVISGAGASEVSASGLGTADTIQGGGESIYFTNQSNTLYENQSLGGTPTVIGGSGADTVFGESAPGIYYLGSPSSRFFAGTGSATVIGSGALFGGSTYTELVASGANTTLVGGAGQSLMFGGQNTQFVVDAGQTTVSGGSGGQTLFTGSAQLTAFLGSNSETVIVQSGTGAIFAGGGPDIFYVNDANAGGQYSLNGFRPGEDLVAVSGYADGALAQAQASQIDAGGSSTLALPDGTRITFVGINTLPTGSIV